MTLRWDVWRSVWAGAPRLTRRAASCSLRLRGWRPSRRWPFLRRDPHAAATVRVEDALHLQACRRSPIHAVIVGAFDGTTNDPGMGTLQALGARVVLLEPQPAVARALAAGYASHALVTVMQVALDACVGQRVLYSVDATEPGVPPWLGQVASFDREHVLKHAAQVPSLALSIREEQVPTVSWDEVLDRVGPGGIDYLQLDVEGHEAVLMDMFPWTRCRPGVVVYEVHHMATSLRERLAADMRSRGYVVVPDPDGWNDLAVST